MNLGEARIIEGWVEEGCLVYCLTNQNISVPLIILND